jgi:hypothetical protein
MSIWEEYDFEQRIEAILREVRPRPDEQGFGPLFMTAYQLAIEFKRRHRADFDQIGKAVGGAGLGDYDSLAKYIDGQLIPRIADRRITRIEAARMSDRHLKHLSFTDPAEPEQPVVSSLTGVYDMPMFRMRSEFDR